MLAVVALLSSLVIALWQWRASGFRPTVAAFVSGSGDSLRVRVRNRGRGLGSIDRVVVTDARGRVVPTTFNSLPDGYSPRLIPAYSRMELTLEAPEHTSYSVENCVIVAWGKHTKVISPLPVDVSFFGLKPILPPQT